MKKVLLAFIVCLSSATHADWQYRSDTDQMTSKKSSFATLESNSSLDLRFPYGGTNNSYLTVRQHPKYGLDVILRIDKGQILCSDYGGCPIEVRFDDAQPIKFEGTEAGDHSSTTVFLQNKQKFILLAKKAKKILVRVNLYQNGAPVMEFFSSKPLEWPTR